MLRHHIKRTNTIYRLVDCVMFLGGPGDLDDRYTALCLLPLNAYNELAFLAIWVWLCFLGLVTVLNIALVLAISCNEPFRAYLIKCGLSSKAKKCVGQLLSESHSIGAWFHLYLVKRNCDDLTFSEFVQSAGKDS